MRADARAKRAALIEAAWRRYADRGSEVSLRSVAEEAGVGIATLYRHFPSEEDLLVGLAEELLGTLREIITAHLARWADSPEQVWVEFVEAVAALQIGALISRVTELRTVDQLPRSVVAQRARSLAVLEELLERAREAGLIDPSIGALQFAAGMAVVSRPLSRVSVAELPEQSALLVRVFIRGVRPGLTTDPSPQKSGASPEHP